MKKISSKLFPSALPEPSILSSVSLGSVEQNEERYGSHARRLNGGACVYFLCDTLRNIKM